jgi:hypothetical protein
LLRSYLSSLLLLLLQLIVESVNIDNSSRSAHLTSSNLANIIVPISRGEAVNLSFYQHFSQKRKRMASGEAPLVPRSTSGIRLVSFESALDRGDATSYEYLCLSALSSYSGTKSKLNFYGVSVCFDPRLLTVSLPGGHCLSTTQALQWEAQLLLHLHCGRPSLLSPVPRTSVIEGGLGACGDSVFR